MPKSRRQYKGRHRWTQDDLDYLMAHYGNPEISTSEMAQKLGVSRHVVTSKACDLGIKRCGSYTSWSDREKNELVAVAETCPIDELTRNWNQKARREGWSPRSKKAIQMMLQELGLSISSKATMPTANSIALALCVAPKVVVGWCKSGKLAHKKNGKIYLIRYEEFCRFVLTYPQTLAAYKKLNWEFVLLTLKEFVRVVNWRGVKK